MNPFTRKLSTKQKIYRLAERLRKKELLLKKGELEEAFDWKELFEFFLGEEKNSPMALKAKQILEKNFSTLNLNSSISEKIKGLNFSYHDLLDLIGKHLKEENFDIQPVVFDRESPEKRFSVSAILDNLRSPFNVGSIFRSADCFGVNEIILCGITPHPPSRKIERTSLGTIETVVWKYFTETKEAIAHVKNRGFSIVAVETIEKAISLFEYKDFQNKAFLFGNEEFGITEEILSICDEFIKIPVVGIKNSMNVATAFSVVMSRMMESLVSS